MHHPRTRPQGLIDRIELAQAQLHEISEAIGVCTRTAGPRWPMARGRLLRCRSKLAGAIADTAAAVEALTEGTEPIEDGTRSRKGG